MKSFWAKVNKNGRQMPGHEAIGNCWEWTACQLPHGYGQLSKDGKKGLRAHRVAWEDANGPIPDGMNVLHRCDNPPCVRPSHLFLGTQKDNMHDASVKSRIRVPAFKGEKNPASKLTPEKVAAIRADTGTCKAIAARHGTSRRNAANIRLGRTWAHS